MEVWSHKKKDMNIGLASSENVYKVLQTTKLPGPSSAVLNFEPQTPYPKRKKLIHGPV